MTHVGLVITITKIFIENYVALIAILKEEIEDNNDSDVAQAKG